MWLYVLRLWPILLIFVLAQMVMWLTGNSTIFGLPHWVSAIDLLLFVAVFGLTAAWVYWPMALMERRGKLNVPVLAQLPWRTLKAFVLAGGLFGTYLLFLLLGVSAASEGMMFTPRIMLSLALSIYFGALVLVPALAVATTIHCGLGIRLRHSPQHTMTANFDDFRPLYTLTDSSRRPWLVFLVTGFIPAALLATYAYLAAGTADAAEEHFVASQGLVLFTSHTIASIYLVFLMSRSLKLVTGELAKGLDHLRHGRFDGRVSVLTEDDLGELARGLNTALEGLKEREELKDSLAIATEIQQGLLPEKPPDVPGYILCGYERSCYSVGGDYYDFIMLPDGRMWLVIADVAGKGYPAALTVANLQAMLHVLAAENVRIDYAVDYINRALYRTLAGGRFVTLFIAKLQPKSHSLLWLNAGHVPPLLLTRSGVDRLQASSPPLGMMPQIEMKATRIELMPGDVLLSYTDGIIEAHAAGNGEMFGEQRLADWLTANRGLPIKEVPDRLLNTLKLFGQNSQEDDITLLCLQREET